MARVRRVKEQEWAIGMDVSQKGTGIVAVPTNWIEDGMDWSQIHFGTSKGEAIKKTLSTTEKLAKRVNRNRLLGQWGVTMLNHIPGRIVGAFVEDYAYANPTGSHQIGEARGVLIHELLNAGLQIPTVVNISTARKFLMGKAPRGSYPNKAGRQWWPRKSQLQPKEVIQVTLRQLVGCPFETDDEFDAFVVVNWGIADMGGTGLTFTEKQWHEILQL